MDSVEFTTVLDLFCTPGNDDWRKFGRLREQYVGKAGAPDTSLGDSDFASPIHRVDAGIFPQIIYLTGGSGERCRAWRLWISD